MLAKLFCALQLCLPHHFLTRCVYRITHIRNRLFKNTLIGNFKRLYNIDMSDVSRQNIEDYDCFCDFFTRELRPETRPLPDQANILVSPVDGTISQFGTINNGTIIQAKGHDYSVNALLAGDEKWSDKFNHGSFITIYLAPRDYHRVHAPMGGKLQRMIHIPGRLFSVNPTTTRTLPGLFARNERVVTLFSTPYGDMAVVLVGALFVGSIDMVWQQQVTCQHKKIRSWDYPQQPESTRGAELGRFNMGSTAIILTSQTVNWTDGIANDVKLLLGQSISQGMVQLDKIN